MKKIVTVLLALCTFCGVADAQPERPRLVVGLVVDQMRWDYLYRYYTRYGEGGFKRLLGEGYSCANTSIPYIPSVTAIGHSCIYTGSVPSISGIAGNNFMENGKIAYCTDDPTVSPVGTDNRKCRMSPRNMWTTTIGDELRLATNNRSKVVGVALKDRASILPAGHHANAAYWFDDKTGTFITSTYYMDQLPDWLVKFNQQKLADKYLSKQWSTLYPKETYTESTADETPYEGGITRGEKAVLPLDLPRLYKENGYWILRSTPFGNNITFDAAKAAIEGEKLGQGKETDMITVSCSSTDILAHQVGINAVEIEDCYLRLDQSIADFLSYLDKKVGKGNYLLFLTADHGGVNNATFMKDQNIPAGTWSARDAAKSISEALAAKYPSAPQLVKSVMNNQVFLDVTAIDSLSLDYEAVKQIVVDVLKRDKDVLYAFDMEKTSVTSIPDDVKCRAINGYNRERSGGVQIVLKPGYYDSGSPRGNTHSAWNPYDTHIPLIFMGWHVTHGETTAPYKMTDIAATVCAMLYIQAPNGCIGKPITF